MRVSKSGSWQQVTVVGELVQQCTSGHPSWQNERVEESAACVSSKNGIGRMPAVLVLRVSILLLS